MRVPSGQLVKSNFLEYLSSQNLENYRLIEFWGQSKGGQKLCSNSGMKMARWGERLVRPFSAGDKNWPKSDDFGPEGGKGQKL